MNTMEVKQLELWPGHTDWAAAMGARGFSTHTELQTSGRLRLHIKKGPPEQKSGDMTEHTVSTPEGNYQILTIPRT